MAITKENLREDADQFSAAFDEEMPAKPEMSEDEAFGLAMPTEDMPPAAPAEGEPEGDASVAIVIAPEEAVEGAVAEETAAASTDMANEGAGTGSGEPAQNAAPALDIEKETQRLKSWEGRLKALEAKLKASGSTAETESAEGEALEDVGEQAEAEGKPDLAEAAEQASDMVEAGQMSATEAMRQLADDFGEEFVRMIEAIATAKAREAGAAAAGEKVGEISKSVDEIIADIVDTKTRTHFERIADAHPDFNEIGQSPEFSAWIQNMPEDKRADAERVVQGGSAKEIIKLLDGFKASAATATEQAPTQTDPAVDAAMDAAEGVRSSGLKLPEEPTRSDDYKEAWSEF